ncbi:MAG: 2OG-Fe(II) oxygenase [Pseudomonadota bacterium]|nr:2OG-Fe(II) oxygenase [Pseudomonadota bacterium]
MSSHAIDDSTATESADAPAGGEDFIAVFDDALSPEQCAALVERFAGSADVKPGRVGSGVFTDLKDSSDLTVSGRADWSDVEAMLNTAVFAGLVAYLRRYPHTLIAPLMLEIPGANGARHRLTPERLTTLDDEALSPIVQTVLRPGAINLQRYSAGRGGYPYWHCELYPRDPNAETLHRHLLWTIYLNDGFSDGETEFLYQRRKIVPRTGSLLIAPAAFTHTHRGNRPQGGDKVIATSWVLFQRAEQLFGTR